MLIDCPCLEKFLASKNCVCPCSETVRCPKSYATESEIAAESQELHDKIDASALVDNSLQMSRIRKTMMFVHIAGVLIFGK